MSGTEALGACFGDSSLSVLAERTMRSEDSSHWIQLAEEARLAAEDMAAPEAKAVMLEIAAAYLKQADRIDGEPTQVHLLNEATSSILEPDQD